MRTPGSTAPMPTMAIDVSSGSGVGTAAAAGTERPWHGNRDGARRQVFIHDDVHIQAADSKGVDTGTSWSAIASATASPGACSERSPANDPSRFWG